jgi:hypothetical protein
MKLNFIATLFRGVASHRHADFRGLLSVKLFA